MRMYAVWGAALAALLALGPVSTASGEPSPPGSALG
jgi:hypothetical protein